MWVLPVSKAGGANDSHASDSELIDQLTSMNTQAPGIDSAAIFYGFIGLDKPTRFQMGILGAPPPPVPPVMRELVRRGAASLPTLIAHLNDTRTTGILVGNKEPKKQAAKDKTVDNSFFFMFMLFGSEYDARVGSRPPKHPEKIFQRPFTGEYAVKVGDVCYAIIGQIVNRHLLPVRYQPTAGLIVNSPIESPVLAEEVRRDWGNTDSEGLKFSLLDDLKSPKDSLRRDGALERLQFYYPETYRTLRHKNERPAQ